MSYDTEDIEVYKTISLIAYLVEEGKLLNRKFSISNIK